MGRVRLGVLLDSRLRLDVFLMHSSLLWSDGAVDIGARSHAEVGDGRLLENHLRHGAALQVSIFRVGDLGFGLLKQHLQKT